MPGVSEGNQGVSELSRPRPTFFFIVDKCPIYGVFIPISKRCLPNSQGKSSCSRSQITSVVTKVTLFQSHLVCFFLTPSFRLWPQNRQEIWGQCLSCFGCGWAVSAIGQTIIVPSSCSHDTLAPAVATCPLLRL